MLKLMCSGGKDGSEQMESEGCGNDGLKLLCSGGKDGSKQMESEGCENDRSQVISSVLVDLSECLSCEATCSLVCYFLTQVFQAVNLHLEIFS